MQNETIDKLKNAGYITVTDDSQGIADKVGISGGGDNFPYEYVCPDDFSVIVQPEDWEIEGESWARVELENPIQIPNPYNVKYYKCNGQVAYDGEAYIIVDFGEEYEASVSLGIHIEDHKAFIYRVAIDIFSEIDDPSSITPITLNFTDLIFIGNKKQS